MDDNKDFIYKLCDQLKPKELNYRYTNKICEEKMEKEDLSVKFLIFKKRRN